MRLRVEYRYDPESRNWSFVVPSLGVVGGADTRERAVAEAIEAIEFTLEGDDGAEPPAGGEVQYLQVTVETA